ncbi:uncharacterized protein LOC141629087 [Silene latifolia]|uniref:uncharacterized protein LOC141629087 n=1 Tax=Silene latifolia TaxID=37657 RepID=UPI003D780FB7
MEQMNKLMEKKIAEALSNGGKVFISDATLEDLPKNHSPDEHDHSSCHSTHHSDPFIELKERVPCRLAVIEDGEVTVAAHGMVSPWVEGKKVHNTPLTMQNAQVSIDEVIKAGARLSCPWNGFSKIGEVEGSFAQWPKTLILLGEDEADKGEKTRKRKAKSKDTKESGNKVQKKATSVEMDKGKQHRGEEDERAPLSVEEVKALSYHCQIIEQKLCSLSTTACIKIVIDGSTFNYQENNNDIECYLTVVEIRQMFRYLWLNVVMLLAWESFLYQCATTIETTKLVAYLCPVKLVEYMHNSKQCEAYIAHAMKIQKDKKYIMGAFHEGNHWMLVVVCVGLNTMYILDSRKRDPKKMDIKKVLEVAWVLYCAYGGRRNYNNKSTKVYIKEIRSMSALPHYRFLL